MKIHPEAEQILERRSAHADASERAVSLPTSTRLYSDWAPAVATAFGTVFAGLWIVSRNFRTLGNAREQRRTLWIATLAIAAVVIALLLTPASRIPTGTYNLVLALAVYAYGRHVQGHFLERHRRNGGAFYSMWRAAGVGLAWGAVLTLAVGLVGVVWGE